MKFRAAAYAVVLSISVCASASRAASPNVEVIGHSNKSQITSSHPRGPLILAPNGTFYGAAEGSYDAPGIFFNVTTSGNLTQISTFESPNGLGPFQTGLVPAADGNFYSVAYSVGPGGPYGDHSNGALIRIAPNGTSTFVSDFTGTGAKGPITLIAASDGNLYGATSDGDAQQGGAIFRAETNGKITVLARLPDQYSSATVVEGGDGNLYATVSNPSAPKIFRVTKSGDISLFYMFDSANDGYPVSLLTGPDGKLYGTTSGAAGRNQPSFFTISFAGELTVIGRYSFNLGIALFSASDGNFYATGSVPRGHAILPDAAVYKITPSGIATLLHVYNGYDESLSDLSLGPDGNLYGTAGRAGGQSRGGIFRLTPAGVNSYIYLFAATDFPASALVRGADGALYGMRTRGGARHLGDIYRVGSDGTAVTIAEFDGLNGRDPRARLTLGPDGNLYGSAAGGGTSDLGTIFRVSPSGVITVIASFTQSTGWDPDWPLAIASDGTIYCATTGAPGTQGVGSILKLVPGSGFVVLAANNAFRPASGLTFGPDNKLYGLGFQSNAGMAYSIATDGSMNILYTLSLSDGYPNGVELVSSPAGFFYGTTTSGVFRLSANGEFQRVTSYAATGLMIASDNNLYATQYLTTTLAGRIVRITPDGITLTVATFDQNDGAPVTAPAEGTDHRFYGTTFSSLANPGEIYRATLLVPQIVSVNTQANGIAIITGSGFTAATRVTFSGGVATYSVDSDTQITATLPSGVSANAISITTTAGVAIFPAGSVAAGPAVNISTRGDVGAGDDALIGGFIVQGNQPKKVLIRAVGPSLAQAGVAGALADPLLELHDSSGAVVTSNDDWQKSTDNQAIAATGIPPSDPRESAIIQTLNPGSYTAVVHGAASSTGIALVEIYDLDRASGRLANISTRGRVQTGDEVMIGGFIIGGDAPGRLLVRAIGPSLSTGNAPVAGALADPVLELHDSDGNLMATNDNWHDSLQAQEITDTTIAPSDVKESAIVASLNPGNYTAIVRGVSNSTGVALVEVYKLD